MAKNPFNQRNPWLINDLRAFGIFTTVESSLQNHLFMQNKPKFRKSQMNVSVYITREYEEMDTWSSGKNKAKTNPIQTQFKANTNPIQSQFKPKQTQFSRYLHCKNQQNFLWCSLQNNVSEGFELSSGHLFEKMGFRTLYWLLLTVCYIFPAESRDCRRWNNAQAKEVNYA
jgi:hypothetical protein